MSTLEFTKKQHDILKDALISYLSDLRLEIGDTDKLEFREELKDQEVVLNEILALLS